MTTRPAAPDPQHDQHVAFPDDQRGHHRGGGLPPTAWAPDPGTRLPAPPPSHPRPPRRRVGAAWWVVGAFFALPMMGSVMWSNGVTSDSMMGGMPMEQHQPAQPWEGALDAQILGVRTLEGQSVEGILPDGPTDAIPSGTTTLRLEVAGVGPRGSLQVIGRTGDTSVDERALPFAVEVDTTGMEALEWVVAHSADPNRKIQCRIYAEGNLVAIATGNGMAECALPPPGTR